MGIGPVGAVEKLFGRTGLTFDDLSLIEVNEAFAVQVLAVLSGWGSNSTTSRIGSTSTDPESRSDIPSERRACEY